MGFQISKVFAGLFGKREMRILMVGLVRTTCSNTDRRTFFDLRSSHTTTVSLSSRRFSSEMIQMGGSQLGVV
jgi:hypothetical protein